MENAFYYTTYIEQVIIVPNDLVCMVSDILIGTFVVRMIKWFRLRRRVLLSRIHAFIENV